MSNSEQARRQKAVQDEQQEYEHLKNKNMSKLTMTGKIISILPIEKGTSKAGKEWQKMNFVLDNYSQFNPEVCFNIFGGDKCGQFLATNKVGDEINVHFNLSSREFNGKYYHNIDCWKWDGGALANEPTETAPAATGEGIDDLPF